MSHDMKELRAALTAHAEQPEFKISTEGVRQRAGQQRTRRGLVLTGIAVLAVLAIAAPVLLLKSPTERPAPTASGGLQLPKPETGWRVVDEPIRTGLPYDGTGRTELVLWFQMSDQGAVELRNGVLDPDTGVVQDRDSEYEMPGQRGVSKDSQRGNWVAYRSWSSTGRGYGMYIGDAARIEYLSQVGYVKKGERTAYPASMRRLSSNPKVIAFWADLPSGDEVIAREDSVDDLQIRAYDARGALLETDRPFTPTPPPTDPERDFDPATAPQLGDLIRTGELAKQGEVVVSFNGKGEYVGAVIARRDPETGALREKLAPEGPQQLPFGAGLSGWTIQSRLADGRGLGLGTLVGPYGKITATVNGVSYPVKTAPWSEDPDVKVWWVVTPKGVPVSQLQVDVYDGNGKRIYGTDVE
ncbi:MAG: hypothetical protein ACRDT4_08415 [Micromonosporaceae bacterium]